MGPLIGPMTFDKWLGSFLGWVGFCAWAYWHNELTELSVPGSFIVCMLMGYLLGPLMGGFFEKRGFVTEERGQMRAGCAFMSGGALVIIEGLTNAIKSIKV